MADAVWIIAADENEWRQLSARADGARVFSTGFLLQQDIIADGCDAELWEDHFPMARLAGFRDDLLDYAGTWACKTGRPEFTGELVFDGVDLTCLMDYAACFIFAEVMHNIGIIEALLDRATPERVIAGDPRRVTSKLLREACSHRGIPFECLPEREAVRPAEPKRHSPNPIKGCRSAWRFAKALREYRRSERPLAVLARRARYAVPVAEGNSDRLACLYYDGRDIGEFLRVRSLFSGRLRRNRREARRLCRRLCRLYAELPPPTLDYRGYDLWPFLEPYLDRVFCARRAEDILFANRFGLAVQMPLADMLHDILYAGEYLDAARPDAAIVAQDAWGLDRAVVECAKARNIPTVVLQHGIPAAYYFIRADRMFFWGRYGETFFCARNGEPHEKAVITGNPSMDAPEHYLHVATPPEQLRREMGIGPDERAVLYVGQPFVGLTAGDAPAYWEKQIHAILEASSGIENCRLILRPHPTESTELYDAVARRVGAEGYVFGRQHDLISLLNAADLVVVWNSTVSLDALLLGRRVLILDLYGYDTGIPFDEMGGLPVVRRAEDLRSAIERALDTELDANKVRAFLADQLHAGKQPAARETYDRLAELAGM